MSRIQLPSLRGNAARLIAALALLTPAAAVAADPVADADSNAEAAAALASGPQKRALARISDPFAVAAEQRREQRERRQRRQAREARASGPFHPVLAEVSYGSAEAAFGNARGRPHEGQDVFAPAGTPVVAPTDGQVVDGGSDGGRGNWVAIFDPEREQTYSYFHLSGPATVATGEKVEAGQRVGKVGCTGSCFGDHLHFEVREGRGPYGTAVDPMPMLGKWDRAKG